MFCDDCGNLLDATSSHDRAELVCDACGATCKGDKILKTPVTISSPGKTLIPHQSNADKSSKNITTRSKPSTFPSALRLKRSAVQTVNASDVQTEATIRQTCPQCGREEMRYYTQQLRSADEGSTVFYTCDCGYKWVDFCSFPGPFTLTPSDEIRIQHRFNTNN